MRGFLKYHIKDRWVLRQQSRQLDASKEPPVLVFTMAKVGSLSVYQSLRKFRNLPVFHVHSLDVEEERRNIAYCFENGMYPGSRTPVFLLHDEVLQKNRPYRIISLFRNPIERTLSAFFDAFRLYVGVDPKEFIGTMEDLERIFHEKIPHDYAIDWYGRQFIEGTGINVYDYPFDSHKGQGHISQDGVDVLLLNSDVDDTLKEILIREFCGLERFQLTNVNVTAQSRSAELYEEFKSHIRFSEAYLKKQLDSEYARHFLSEENRKQLIEKWMKQ